MIRNRAIIQTGDNWVRVLLNGVVIIDTKKLTIEDIRDLFVDLGMDCIIQYGDFKKKPKKIKEEIEFLIFGEDDGKQKVACQLYQDGLSD